VSKMVERVAKEIFIACGYYQKEIGEFILDDWIPAARAAIAAMREPTDEMISASNREWPHVRSNWKAMVDAALRGTP
jgi:hypothetical protein